jgi:hypothetical protein
VATCVVGRLTPTDILSWVKIELGGGIGWVHMVTRDSYLTKTTYWPTDELTLRHTGVTLIKPNSNQPGLL